MIENLRNLLREDEIQTLEDYLEYQTGPADHLLALLTQKLIRSQELRLSTEAQVRKTQELHHRTIRRIGWLLSEPGLLLIITDLQYQLLKLALEIFDVSDLPEPPKGISWNAVRGTFLMKMERALQEEQAFKDAAKS